jgi:hypothetical protein
LDHFEAAKIVLTDVSSPVPESQTTVWLHEAMPFFIIGDIQDRFDSLLHSSTPNTGIDLDGIIRPLQQQGIDQC